MTLVIEKAQPGVDRLRHSLVSQVASKIFQLLVSIGIGGWTARYLGPTALGKLSYVSSLVAMLAPLGSLGVMGSLSALLRATNPLPGLVSSAFCIELIGTLLIAAVITPFAILSRDSLVVGLFALAVAGNLFNSVEVLEADLFNRHQGVTVARVGLMQALAVGIFSALALLMQAPVIIFGTIQLLQAVVKAFLLFLNLGFLSIGRWLSSVSLGTVKILIERGRPLMLSGFAIVIYMKSDLVMLEWLSGSSAVGKYSVAVRVAESLYFLPLVLSQTFLPRLTPEVSGQSFNKSLSKPLKQLYQTSWMLGVSMTLATAIILPSLLLLVFGQQYQESVQALQFLAPAGFAVAIGCASGAWLNLNNYADIIFGRTLLGAAVNIILNLILIPKYGISGAAIATSASQLIAANLQETLDSRTRINHRFLLFPF